MYPSCDFHLLASARFRGVAATLVLTTEMALLPPDSGTTTTQAPWASSAAGLCVGR